MEGDAAYWLQSLQRAHSDFKTIFCLSDKEYEEVQAYVKSTPSRSHLKKLLDSLDQSLNQSPDSTDPTTVKAIYACVTFEEDRSLDQDLLHYINTKVFAVSLAFLKENDAKRAFELLQGMPWNITNTAQEALGYEWTQLDAGRAPSLPTSLDGPLRFRLESTTSPRRLEAMLVCFVKGDLPAAEAIATSAAGQQTRLALTRCLESLTREANTLRAPEIPQPEFFI